MKDAIWGILLLVPILSFGQSAPDFNLTDSDGVQHSLYTDYLNAGKTVLIEIFFTDCPPCNSIAPLMQPLYEDWGAGDYDVEFFELSNKSYDDDERVNDFKALFGITFPSVGADGGSLEAVQPYQNGTFGPFFGTPTFAVVAPDGTVNYNVRGPNNQATIEAIDEALAATGAMKPSTIPDSAMVGGLAQLYFNTEPIFNVRVEIFDINDPETVLADGLTSVNGEFNITFDSAGIDFTQYALRAVKENAPANGVSGADLFVIQRHILNISLLEEPQQYLASDGNASGAISTLDLVRLLKITLGLTPHFDDGLSWIFYSTDTSPSTPDEILANQTVPLTDAMAPGAVTIFKGIKKGDVNHSVNPQN